MAYVAVKGGREAIENSVRFFESRRNDGSEAALSAHQIRHQLHALVDRVMGEGSLYAPYLAALAVKQSAGDPLEAAFMIRAYRTTLPRLARSVARTTSDMRVIRRLSSAFKDIPGGQYLGPSPDYSLRLLDFRLESETRETARAQYEAFLKKTNLAGAAPDTFPKLIELLRAENLLVGRSSMAQDKELADVTRAAPTFPASRSATLQTMARGETGGMLALAYSNMRGYGSSHPTIGELRVGYVPVHCAGPLDSRIRIAGEVLMTEAEIISGITLEDGSPKFRIGYGICFGHNETKAISMGVLDVAMRVDEPRFPSEDQEFVLTHIDGIEAMGFANHFKLPHYVTFQSELDRIRRARRNTQEHAGIPEEDRP